MPGCKFLMVTEAKRKRNFQNLYLIHLIVTTLNDLYIFFLNFYYLRHNPSTFY